MSITKIPSTCPDYHASGLVADINNALDDVQSEIDSLTTAPIDTDGTLAADSDTVVASQKATKTYVDTAVALLASIPTSDPGVAGVIWNDSGTLKASAGS